MATFNQCALALRCPRCAQAADMTVDLYPGDTSMMVTLSIGDPYPLGTGEPATLTGDGYAECPACARDFHCVVQIVDGRLERIAVDTARFPFIPDNEAAGVMACGRCGSRHTRLRTFDGFADAELICDAPTSSCAPQHVQQTSSRRPS